MNASNTNLDVEAADHILVSPGSAGAPRMLQARREFGTVMATQRETAGGAAASGKAAALGAADWLSLAAAPTFAIMAVLTSFLGGGQPDMLCSTVQNASLLSGMVPMYVLMSAFHAATWLKLVSGR